VVTQSPADPAEEPEIGSSEYKDCMTCIRRDMTLDPRTDKWIRNQDSFKGENYSNYKSKVGS
jgi:hypothetical protein